MNDETTHNPSPSPTPIAALEAEVPRPEPGPWAGFEAEMEARVRSYMTATPEGFEQLQLAIILLEIERDPATGEPKLTADGKFSFPMKDAKGSILFWRFLNWQRCWHLWPQLEHNVNTATNFTEAQKKEALDAISHVRALLGEVEPKNSGVC